MMTDEIPGVLAHECLLGTLRLLNSGPFVQSLVRTNRERSRLWDAPSNFTIPYGASWGSDGTIVFAQAAAGLWRGGLWRISATGGNAALLTTVDEGRSAVSHPLP